MEDRFSLRANGSTTQVPSTAVMGDGKNWKLVTKVFSKTEAFAIT